MPVDAAGRPPLRAIWTRRLVLRVLRCLGRCCDCLVGFFDVFVRVTGPFFVALALSLFALVAYSFFVLALPSASAGGAYSPVAVRVHGGAGVFLLANLLFNYAMAICVDPGSPPMYSLDPTGEDAERGEPLWPQKCRKCLREKPPRAHHCSVCRRCVLKMDHHCPWINNCVGFRNYRYFCLFLLYLMMCCLYFAIFTWRISYASLLDPISSSFNFIEHQCIVMSWLISVCIFFALLLLGGFHTHLVLTNQTTIEFHINSGERSRAKKRGESFGNVYDLGRRRNFQEALGGGPCDLRWLLPGGARPPA